MNIHSKITCLSVALLSMASLAGCGHKRTYPVHKHYIRDLNRDASHEQQNYLKHHNVNYNKPSQSQVRSYPKALNAKTDRIFVSIRKQRVYLIHKNRVMYTMYCSTGSHNRTPRGTFHIQSERGNYFYAPSEHEGAKYYVSFKGHGTYLFHSTPVNKNKQVMKGVARQLGKRPSSHGCVHLTFPDARYLSVKAPVGMKVVIH